MKSWSILLVFMVFSMVSCQKTSKTTLGFLIHSSSNSRWQEDLKYIREYTDEKGIEFVFRDAGGDENVQLKQAEELLEIGVDIIAVVAANQNTAGGIVRDAHKHNVPVISYDRLIKNCDLDYLISFEYEKVGELLVNYVADHAKGENCVMLWGDSGDGNAIFVKKGAEKALQERDDIKVYYQSYIEGWRGDVAYKKMSKILDFSNEQVDAVLACNVPLGIATIEALDDHRINPGEVLVTGQDINEEFLKLMLEGKAAVTVTKPIKKMAYGLVDLVEDISLNNKIEFKDKVYNGRKEVNAKLFAPSLVTRENYIEVLVRDNAFTEEELKLIENKVMADPMAMLK